MPRETDTSRAVCDTCGRIYQEGDAVYSIADRWDGDVLVSFRHWDCHTPVERLFEDVRETIQRAEDALRRMR